MKYKHGGIWVTRTGWTKPKYLWIHKKGQSVSLTETRGRWFRVRSDYDPTTYDVCRLAPLILGVWNEN